MALTGIGVAAMRGEAPPNTPGNETTAPASSEASVHAPAPGTQTPLETTRRIILAIQGDDSAADHPAQPQPSAVTQEKKIDAVETPKSGLKMG